MWDALCRSQPTILPSSEVFGLFHIGCTAEYFHYIWFSWATWASPKTSPRCSQCEFSNLLTRVHVWNGPFCDFNCWHSFTPPHRPERDKAAFWRKHHHWQQIDFLFCVVFSFFSLSSFSLSPWTLSACPLFSPILHCVLLVQSTGIGRPRKPSLKQARWPPQPCLAWVQPSHRELELWGDTF